SRPQSRLEQLSNPALLGTLPKSRGARDRPTGPAVPRHRRGKPRADGRSDCECDCQCHGAPHPRSAVYIGPGQGCDRSIGIFDRIDAAEDQGTLGTRTFCGAAGAGCKTNADGLPCPLLANARAGAATSMHGAPPAFFTRGLSTPSLSILKGVARPGEGP